MRIGEKRKKDDDNLDSFSPLLPFLAFGGQKLIQELHHMRGSPSWKQKPTNGCHSSPTLHPPPTLFDWVPRDAQGPPKARAHFNDSIASSSDRACVVFRCVSSRKGYRIGRSLFRSSLRRSSLATWQDILTTKTPPQKLAT